MSRILFDSFDNQDNALILAAIESADVLSISAEALISAALDVTDVADTASVTAESIITMLCGMTESADIAAAGAENIINFACDAKEKTDIVKIVIPGNKKKSVGVGSPDWVELLKYFTPKKAVMSITENRDSAWIEIETRADKKARARIVETGDGSRFMLNIPSYSSMEISELRDGAAAVDVRLFREQVRKLNEDYEQNEMIIFALAS